jgi:glutamine synthetase
MKKISNFDDAHTYIKQNHIRMIDLKFSDLWGHWRHVTVPSNSFDEEIMDEGIGFDGSSVGFKSVHSGDMVLVPDLETAFIDPFWEEPTLSFICNTMEADTKRLFIGDPRQVLRNADKYLKSGGIADESLWGPEFEFYVFDQLSFRNEINSSSYQVNSYEANWNSGVEGHGYTLPLHSGYHAIPPNDKLYNLRSEISLKIEEAGIPVKYHHHEVGGPGQCEIETPMMPLQQAADSIMLIKYFTRMTAQSHDQIATFLPKPLFGEAGNGMHFHQQLILSGENVFYDAENPILMSDTALFYIGGLLTHAASVLAFTNPSTNSYRRLIPGFEAPVNAFFSSGNRSAAIRIPKYATLPHQVRFEFRPPDATCNPYLAMAAMLLAGLDGVINKIDPTEAGFGPINEDIFSWPPKKQKSIKSLPTSLHDALIALEKDVDFLLKDNIFPPSLIDQWLAKKYEEDKTVRSRPHPYEIELYSDI